MKQPSEILLVTLIQGNLHWEDKSANLNMFEKKISGVEERMEVVLLPEMFSTGFSMDAAMLAETMDGPTIDWMKRVASQKKVILAGSVIINDGGNFYNRFIWMLPDKTYGYYDKRHLFAYGGEDGSYTAGKKRLITSVKGCKINLQIC